MTYRHRRWHLVLWLLLTPLMFVGVTAGWRARRQPAPHPGPPPCAGVVDGVADGVTPSPAPQEPP